MQKKLGKLQARLGETHQTELTALQAESDAVQKKLVDAHQGELTELNSEVGASRVRLGELTTLRAEVEAAMQEQRTATSALEASVSRKEHELKKAEIARKEAETKKEVALQERSGSSSLLVIDEHCFSTLLGSQKDLQHYQRHLLLNDPPSIDEFDLLTEIGEGMSATVTSILQYRQLPVSHGYQCATVLRWPVFQSTASYLSVTVASVPQYSQLPVSYGG